MGFTLPEFRANLRLDLRDVDDQILCDADINRCVKRAVDDLSRYMPLEKVYEVTFAYDVDDESFTTPATASATAIVNAQTLNGVADGDTLTITDTTPDVPRRLTVKLTDANASITALTIIVKGYDKDGYYVEESWFLKDLPSGTAVQGKEYFKYVSEVEVDDVAGTQDVADTISVGTGNAYDSYISLSNKPIKPRSEVVTSSPAGTTYARDTDYTIDYANGSIKFINGGSMAAGTAYLISYHKSRIGIDIAAIIPIITRIQRVEYPMNQVPQKFVSFNVIGDFMYVGSPQPNKSQEEIASGEHIAIFYERRHTPPGEVGPGSYPSVLDEVITIGAGGYALLISAQGFEKSASLALTSLDDALTNVITYLNNNTGADMAGLLQDITDNAASLRTALNTAVDAANAYLDEVDVTDLGKASVGAEAFTETGDDKIDTVNIGSSVAENYATYSRARVEIANARMSAALGYIQEASTRLSNLRTFIEEAGGYNQLAQGFIAEAQLRAESVNGYLVLSDRYRTEGLNRLTEFHQILRTKSEYRKRVSSTPVNQPP